MNIHLDPRSVRPSDLWPAGTSHPECMNFSDPPIATFRSHLDAPWFERAYQRWASTNRRDLSPWLSALLLGLAMSAILLLFVTDSVEARLTRFLVCILAGALISPLGYWGALHSRRHAKSLAVKAFCASRDFEVACNLAIHREGLVTAVPIAVTVRRWSGFIAARRYSDGLLILLSPHLFHWLPWSDLASGAADDVDAILRANIADYKEVRG